MIYFPPIAIKHVTLDLEFFLRIKSSHFSGTVKPAPAAHPAGTGIKEGSLQLPLLLVEQEAKSILIGRKADELNVLQELSARARPVTTPGWQLPLLTAVVSYLSNQLTCHNYITTQYNKVIFFIVGLLVDAVLF